MNKRNYRMTASAKILIIEIVISMAGIISGFTWNLYSRNKAWDKLIYPNVSVSGIYLGGKTPDEGKELIQKQFVSRLLSKDIVIEANGKSFTLDKSRIISDNNVNVVVSEAYNYGKNFNELQKYETIKYSEQLKNFNIDFSINEDYIKESVNNICSQINREPSNASLYFSDDGEMQIIDDKKGIKVDEGALEADIKNKVLAANSDSIQAKLEEIPASITHDMLSKLNTKVASFSTNFTFSSAGRTHNIELAAKSINGKLLMPGDIFSFNDTVGERTVDRGYKEAPVIVGFSIDSGLGGGICQVSSTLYNAVLKTGLESEERVRHSIPSDYVPLGLDATVDWNNIDYKFKNTLKYPIYIQSYTENNVLKINIFSDSSLTGIEYKIWNEVYETIPSEIQIVDNSNMEEGETSITQKGYQGYKVKVHRDTYENGVLAKDEIVSDDYYPPIPKIINRGVRALK